MKKKNKNCNNCGRCSRQCPMSLDVIKEVNDNKFAAHSDCILCGVCADICPKKHIGYSFSKPDIS